MESTDSTRNKIIARALPIFAELGFEAGTVKKIAKAVGIKASSLYAHFKNKEEIFLAVLERAAQDYSDVVDEAFGDADAAPSLTAGLSMILFRYASHITQADTYRFWARIYVFPPAIMGRDALDRLGRMDTRFYERLAEYCRARAPSRIGQGMPELLASCLVHILGGFMVSGGLSEDSNLQKEIDASVQLLVRGFERA